MTNATINSDLLLAHLLDATTDTAIAVIDTQFRLVHLNPTASELFHCATGDVLGRSIRDLHIGNQIDAERFDAAAQDITQGRAFEYCIEQPRENGMRYLGMRISGLWDDQRLIGYLLLARDITPRHLAEMKLAEEERHYRNLYEQAPIPYHSLDADGRVRHVNRAWLETFGYSEEDVLGQTLFQHLIEPDARAFVRGFQRFKRVGEIHNLVFVFRHADGRPITVSLNGRAVYDEEGHFHHTHCILIDITRQRAAEEAMRRSEERYRSLFQNSRDALLLHDPQSLCIEDCNPAAESLFGYSLEELRAMRIPELSAEREDTLRVLKRMQEKQLPVVHVKHRHILCKNGTRLPIELDVVRVNVGGHDKLLGTLRDISDRLRLEQSLRAREQWLTTLMETVPYGIEETDREGRILYANPAYHHLFGYKPRTLIGRTIWELMPDEEQRTIHRIIRTRQFEETPSQETIYADAQRRDCSAMEIQIDWDYRRNEEGEVTSIISVITDITERRRTERALRDSEERFRSIFTHSAAGMATADPSGRYLAVNPAFCRLLGYSEAELLEKSVRDITHPDDWQENQYKFQQAASGQIQNYQLQKRYLHKDGSIVWGLVSSTWVQDKEGKPIYAIGMVQDINEQKQAIQALRESEERFSLFMDYLPGAVFIKDAEGRTLYVNSYLDRHFGAREWIGKTTRELFPGEIGQAMHEDDCRVLELGQHAAVEKVPERDGTEHIYHTRKFAIPQEGGPSLIGGMAMDVTEQTQNRQDLELARFTLDRAGDAIFWLTPEAQFVYVNEAACRSLGYSHEELLLKGVTDIDPNFTHEMCLKMWGRIKQEGTVRLESLHQRKDGSEFPVEITANHIVFGDKEFNCTIARDVSEQRETQQRLQRAHKMEALGQLTGGIAHDFNNILASVLGFTDLSLVRLEGGNAEKLGSYLREIQTAGRRGKDLVEQMLRFGRANNTRPQQLRLHHLVREIHRLLGSTLPSSIQILEQLDTETPPIMGDPVQIHQALMNLCINARDAMQGKGILTIRLGLSRNVQGTCSLSRDRVSGDWVELSVSDNGPGIAPEIADRIFDPFFTTKEVCRRSGIGLAVVHGILLQHHAHVLVEPAKGGGTNMRLLFPPAENQSADNGQDATHVTHATEKLNGRVLVVDDDLSVLRAICALLEQEGLDAQGESSASLALEQIKKNPGANDLLLLDQTMPELTGVELIREVRRLGIKTPTILCTGYSDHVNEENAAQFGINQFLRKPLDRMQLLDTIKSLLNGSCKL